MSRLLKSTVTFSKKVSGRSRAFFTLRAGPQWSVSLRKMPTNRMKWSYLNFQWTTCAALRGSATLSWNSNEKSRARLSLTRLVSSHTGIRGMLRSSYTMDCLPTVLPTSSTSSTSKMSYIRRNTDSITINTIISSLKMKELCSWNKSSLFRVSKLTWFRFNTVCQSR